MVEEPTAEQPTRGESEERLVSALRGTFDVSVMNFGSYNILYAANLHARDARASGQEHHISSVHDGVSLAEHLLVGYRRQPMELVLCPVDLDDVLSRVARAAPDPAADAVPAVPLPVNLTNLAGMAAEGRQLEIAMSTGHRVVLEVHPQVSFEALPDVTLGQRHDVEDFYDFVDFFMDRLEEMNPV
ncbi:hypothetical protein [Nesterenkonia xinjiangensis]|uniref:Uncharacterized protein n=1 Tax=Nesterenkonia xinjiangensis TaxID=225327 RepID=A0A7Z0K7I1_9MICC|nr:hypothetical protein [Nesterenkonia xinjiangensis]NYJ76626.1 hypothetical protein [Nesterenkonia xinjiangensis]